jgi:hypothetical protein
MAHLHVPVWAALCGIDTPWRRPNRLSEPGIRGKCGQHERGEHLGPWIVYGMTTGDDQYRGLLRAIVRPHDFHPPVRQLIGHKDQPECWAISSHGTEHSVKGQAGDRFAMQRSIDPIKR